MWWRATCWASLKTAPTTYESLCCMTVVGVWLLGGVGEGVGGGEGLHGGVLDAGQA